MKAIPLILAIGIDAFGVAVVIAIIKAYIIRKNYVLANIRKIGALLLTVLILLIISFFLHQNIGLSYLNRMYMLILAGVGVATAFTKI